MTKMPTDPVRVGARRLWLAMLCALALGLATAPAARAERTLLSTEVVRTNEVPGAGIEGACGVALAGDSIYVSDYYHHAVAVFNGSGKYEKRISGNPLDGPCGLATAATGALYANDWHAGVSRLLPSSLGFDSSESTGVAVDQASGNVYVNDRSYIAVYQPSGATVEAGGEPLRIGLGTLGDGYGVAVAAGRVYVPDAAEDTVKVYEPALDPVNPVLVIDGAATPQGRFVSLVDAAVAIDPTNGHLLVLDNLQPGFEHPEAALDEFDPAGNFLGQVAQKVIDGEPSGLAFSDSTLYATSGNSEGATLFSFGSYTASVARLATPSPDLAAAPSGPVAASAPAAKGQPHPRRERKGSSSARASEVVQGGGTRVSFDGKLAPRALPRSGSTPVRVAVAAKIRSTDGGPPLRLREIKIAINRYGHFEPQGLPVCTLRDIQPSTTAKALEACGGSLVGQGTFSAKVLLGRQAPFPSAGKLYAFNGILHGRPAILAHVYGTDPVPTSFTLPFELRSAKGTFGTVLRASLPSVTGDSGYVTGLSMNLGKSFRSHGKRRSYLSASCPAPKGLRGAIFPFARASFGFGKRTLSSTLTRTCKVRE